MSVKIHGKEYRTVAERVNEVHKKYKDNVEIQTKLISWKDGIVIMKATVKIHTENRTLTFVDYAYEKEDSTTINKTSILENCSTSAIGRALSAASFGGEGMEYASADEVANAINQQQSSDGNNGDKYYSMTGEMTGKQTALIEKLCNSHVITTDEKDDTDEWLKNDRTKGEASKMIDRLKEMIDGREAVEKLESK